MKDYHEKRHPNMQEYSPIFAWFCSLALLSAILSTATTQPWNPTNGTFNGSDGSGGFSSLTIADAAKSSVSFNAFTFDNTSLNLLIRSGAQLEVIEIPS